MLRAIVHTCFAMVVALAVLGPPARAQDPEAGTDATATVAEVLPASGDEATERLDAYREAGDWATVALRSRAWAALFPDHFGPHYYAGVTYLMTNQFDEAARELRTSVRLAPAFTEGHLRLGITLVLAGDDANARIALERALALEPGNEDAAGELRDLDTRARLDGAPPPPAPAEGTPARVAWEVFGAVARGELDKAWADHIDVSVGDALFAGQAPAERAENEQAFLKGALEGWEKSAQFRLLGWELPPQDAPGSETATVLAAVLLESTPLPSQTAQQLELVYSPLGAQVFDPEVMAIFRALPREEVEASFRRMGGRPTRTLSEARFALVRRGEAWKVADVTLDTPGVGEVGLSTIIANQAEIMRAAREKNLEAAKESLPFAIGYVGGMCGMTACLLAGVGGAVALGVRLARRG